MEIKELYKNIDGNYDELLARIGNEKIIQTLLQYFLEDKNKETLCEAMAAGDYEGAFRAAHGLKGLCANLAFTGVLSTASEITEALRNGTDIEKAKQILPELEAAYDSLAKEISEYVSGK